MVSKKSKNRNRMLLIGVIGIVAIALIGDQLGWFAGAPIVEPDPVLPNYYEINLSDGLDSDNEIESASSQIDWYYLDIEDLDQDELADTLEELTWDDLVFDESDDRIDYDPERYYVVKINVSGFVPNYYSTNVELFDGLLPLLDRGVNNISLTNITEDVSMIGYSTDTLNLTFNQTTQREWTLRLQTLDGIEGGSETEKTSKEGYVPYYSPESVNWETLVLRIEFNESASLTYVNLLSSYINREKVSVNYTYIEVDAVLIDELVLDLKLGSGLNTDFEVLGISVGYGNADDYIEWDSQN